MYAGDTAENEYFEWLCEYVALNRGHDQNTLLIQQLYSVPYKAIFTDDDNRISGGLNLRNYYAYDVGIWSGSIKKPCTVLEVLIGLADSIVSIMGDSVSRWFWEMLDNMTLTDYTDSNYDSYQVSKIIGNWLERKIARNGEFTPFPLKYGNVRNMPLRDQMNAYLNERYPLGDWIEE